MQRPTWREAMHEALYGRPDGFFRRERPADHFRTSIHASPLFAQAVAQLAAHAGADRVLDVGAGSGEMLAQLDTLTDHLELVGVELAARPAGLARHIGWRSDLPERMTRTLIIANEWLDNVPLDVAQIDDDGRARMVHVDPSTGEESFGELLSGLDLAWSDAWWPGATPGERIEIGRFRDDAWADLTKRATNSLCVAIDYHHTRARRPQHGTLSAYQHGRAVALIPDGSRDVTAHVALDSVAAAGLAAGATASVVTTQRAMLQALGASAALPPRELALDDPGGYARALAGASQGAELMAKNGLGGFGWLIQAVGRDLPEVVLAASDPPPL